MAVLQFICFLVLVVGCLSLCSYYNARIEELEEEIERLHINKVNDDLFTDIVHDFKGDLAYLQHRIETLENKVIELEERVIKNEKLY